MLLFPSEELSTFPRQVHGYEDEFAGELAANWAAGKKAAQKTVAAALQKAQLTMEDVMAETLEDKIDSFERFDRMLAGSEARRNNALREIERHRAASAP